MAPVLNKAGSSRRDSKDGQDRRDNKRSAESPRRQADHEGDRRPEVDRPEWSLKCTRRSVAGQSALVSRDRSQAKRAKHAAETFGNGGSSSGGARSSSRNTAPNSLSSRHYNLERGLIYTSSPSAPRAASDSRRVRFSAVASGSQAKNAPPNAIEPEERLDLDGIEFSSEDDIDSLGIPEALADIESLLDVAAGPSLVGVGDVNVAERLQDNNRLNQLPHPERARHLKGKGVLQVSEQLKMPAGVMTPAEQAWTEKGALELLERMHKLKEKTTSYVSKLVSDSPRFDISSVRSIKNEPVNSLSLVLPVGSLKEERSADIIRGDLAHLHRLLRKTPLNGVEVVDMLKILTDEWAKLYPSPLPADLELLMNRLGALAQRLEHGSTFEETLNKAEVDARTHLLRLEAACSEVAADLGPIKGSRIDLVCHGLRATSMKEEHASRVAEYEQKLREYEQKVKEYKKKMTAVRKRKEELRRLEGLAMEDLEAFDKDVKSQGNNIGRLMKLRDEMKDQVAQVVEEKKRLQAGTPADVAVILAYSVKPPGEEAEA